MSTRDPRTPDVSAGEILDEAAAFLFSGGLITMVFFPFALPIILLIVVPLMAVAVMAGALMAVVAGAPYLAFRLARSLVSAYAARRKPVGAGLGSSGLPGSSPAGSSSL